MGGNVFYSVFFFSFSYNFVLFYPNGENIFLEFELCGHNHTQLSSFTDLRVRGIDS